MEILTAYVREHARWSPERGQEGAESDPTEAPTPAAPDIQAILSVIRRRTRSIGHGEPEALDLHETRLTRAHLSRAYLDLVDLRGADLRGADLHEAHLPAARLEGADLFAAVLMGADLNGATLNGARLDGALLNGADLSFARFNGATLNGTYLRGANLTQARFLTQEQLEVTTGNKNTQLPPGLKPPAHWGVGAAEQIEGG
jgi:hypothetical protein